MDLEEAFPGQLSARLDPGPEKADLLGPPLLEKPGDFPMFLVQEVLDVRPQRGAPQNFCR